MAHCPVEALQIGSSCINSDTLPPIDIVIIIKQVSDSIEQALKIKVNDAVRWRLFDFWFRVVEGRLPLHENTLLLFDLKIPGDTILENIINKSIFVIRRLLGLPPKSFPQSFRTYCFFKVENALKRDFIDINFPNHIIEEEDIKSPSESETESETEIISITESETEIN